MEVVAPEEKLVEVEVPDEVAGVEEEDVELELVDGVRLSNVSLSKTVPLPPVTKEKVRDVELTSILLKP